MRRAKPLNWVSLILGLSSILVCCRRSAVRAPAAATAKSAAAAGVRLFGLQQQRRQNPPPTQAFGCSGSISSKGSKTAAGFSCSGSISSGDKSTVDDGKTHRRRRRSAVRAPSAARAAKRPQGSAGRGPSAAATNPPSTTAKSTADAGVRLFGLHQQRGQQNGSRVRLVGVEGSKTAAGFGWSGSSEGEGSKTAADVQLVGLQEGGNVKER